MSPTAFTLLSLVAWTVALLLSLGVYRSALVLGGARAANSFNATGEDLDGFGKRLTRAHANCYESLPIIGIVFLYAIATGQTAVTDGLAFVVLGARIAQSVTHIISTSRTFVFIRFGFFLVQIGILVFWLLKLFQYI
ncbi:MAG: MAPEG family protein [Pseudomonadota bacterium]